eukprot:717779_1
MFIWLNRIRGKWAASSAYSYGDNACIESTDAKEYTSYSYLKPIVALFLIQLVCTVIFPTIDIFLDLRGFSPFIYKRIISLYPDSKHKNRICCPGAGFSGFWFSLGRLHAIEADAQIKIKKNRTIAMQYFDDSHGTDDDDDDDNNNDDDDDDDDGDNGNRNVRKNAGIIGQDRSMFGPHNSISKVRNRSAENSESEEGEVKDVAMIPGKPKSRKRQAQSQAQRKSARKKANSVSKQASM